VRRTIADQQKNSEILIGWIQFGLVLFFMTLYAVAPKTSAGTGFLPSIYRGASMLSPQQERQKRLAEMAPVVRVFAALFVSFALLQFFSFEKKFPLIFLQFVAV